MIDIYNFKVKDYGRGRKQVKIYQNPIYSNVERKELHISALEEEGVYRWVRERLELMQFEPLEGEIEEFGFKADKIDQTDYIEGLKERIRNKEQESANRALSVSRSRTVNKVYDYARANDWDYFCTFTFDSKRYDRYDYAELSRAMRNWLKNLKKTYSSDLRYVVVPEIHKDGAYHFHALISHCDDLTFQVAISPKTGRKIRTKGGLTVYNMIEYTLGHGTVTKVVNTDKASNYLTKYITKQLCILTKGKKRYWVSSNLELPVETNSMCTYEQIECVRDSIEPFVVNTKVQEIKNAGMRDQRIEYIELKYDNVQLS